MDNLCAKRAELDLQAWVAGVTLLELLRGAVAQLGARLNGIQKVSGSIPLSSTKRTPSLTGFFYCL